MRPISWLLAVSLLSMELNVRTSEKLPSTTWPPFLPAWTGVAVPPPQASRSSRAPPEKAVQAAVAPIRRRKSRRDQFSRNLSNCSKPLSSSSWLISLPPAGPGFPGRLSPAHRPSYWQCVRWSKTDFDGIFRGDRHRQGGPSPARKRVVEGEAARGPWPAPSSPGGIPGLGGGGRRARPEAAGGAGHRDRKRRRPPC